MDDFLPFKLFNINLLDGSIKNKDWNMVIYLLIPISINILLRYKNKNRKERITISHICIFTILTLYSIIMKDRSKKISTAKLDYTMHSCIHISNYLYAMIIAMKKIDESFPSGRIGSKISEHMFARIRGESGK